jgi:S1-C subfamily serine protease
MAQSTNVLDFSRKSTVLLTSQSASSKGSGVFLGDQIVLTCFHVVATITVKGPNVNWSVFPDLQVVLPSGESISGTVMSVPTPADLTPLTQDFAFVKLKNKPTTAFSIAQLATDKEGLNVGDEVAFSGYPLATPGMVTHRGMVSGFDSSGALIFVQAAINKGNSGGALLNSSGHVVGLISMREGGISVGLQQLRIYIDKTSSQGSVQIMGVDPLQATKAIIETIDQYISTGIGYARAIKFAREFRNKNPGIFK